MAELMRQADEKSRLLRQTGSASLELTTGQELLEEAPVVAKKAKAKPKAKAKTKPKAKAKTAAA